MTNFYCDLAILPLPLATYTKYGHTVTGLYVIGGYPQTSSIIDYKFNMDKGGWDPIYGSGSSVQLLGHSAWKNSEGILLMGGKILSPYDSSGTLNHTYLFHTETYKMEKKFSLIYPSYFSCAIDDTRSRTVILTGGSMTSSNDFGGRTPHKHAFRYGEDGSSESLPDMNYNRTAHGCGGYYNDEGILVRFLPVKPILYASLLRLSLYLAALKKDTSLRC